MAEEKASPGVQLDAVAIDKIDHLLLTKRRSAVFNALPPGVQLSQRDLAKAIGASATALANILAIFNIFEYSLLETSSVGKYKFYRLSALGEAYFRAKNASPLPADLPLDAGEHKLTYEAKAAIQAIKGLLPNSWESAICLLLDKRLYGHAPIDCQDRFGLSGDAIQEVEGSLSKYLSCIQELELESDVSALEKVLSFTPSPAVKEHVTVISDIFGQFSPILNSLDSVSLSFDAHRVLSGIFSGEDAGVSRHLKALGLSVEDHDRLRHTAVFFKETTSHMDEEGVYKYFSQIFPERASFCAYMAKCVCCER